MAVVRSLLVSWRSGSRGVLAVLAQTYSSPAAVYLSVINSVAAVHDDEHDDHLWYITPPPHMRR